MRERHSKSNCRWYWTLIDCIFFYTIIPMIKSNLWIKHSKRVTITNAKKEQLQKSTVIKVMWIWFLSKHLIVRYSPLVLWWREMIKCLRVEIKWGEWHRHCDVALGYHWPDDSSEGGSLASGSRLTVIKTPESETVDKGQLPHMFIFLLI